MNAPHPHHAADSGPDSPTGSGAGALEEWIRRARAARTGTGDPAALLAAFATLTVYGVCADPDRLSLALTPAEAPDGGWVYVYTSLAALAHHTATIARTGGHAPERDATEDTTGRADATARAGVRYFRCGGGDLLGGVLPAVLAAADPVVAAGVRGVWVDPGTDHQIGLSLPNQPGRDSGGGWSR